MKKEIKTDEEVVVGLITSLDDIESINRGGCLFAAYATYLKAQQLGINGVSIVQIDYNNGYFINTNKAFLKGDVSSPTSSSHFVVHLNNKMYDSNGEFNGTHFQSLLLSSSEDIHKLCVPSLRGACWNSSFNREYGVNRIKKILGIDLSHCL